MRIDSIQVIGLPPVLQFEAHTLSDLVVIAGPNGVGKTRLIQALITYLRGDNQAANVTCDIRATSELERGGWGKDALDLSVPA